MLVFLYFLSRVFLLSTEVCRYFETEEKILKYYVRCRRKTACIKINYLEEKNRQKKQKSRLVGSSNKYFNLILFFVLADF